jgi:hypothetical protein
MPYENSLVVLSMNGPQLKAVLERAYRNYYYYKYVPSYGGYSYYTTCMIDTNAGNQITYDDEYPTLPNGNNVVALSIGGVLVNFNDATKYYNVSTVNYLAAGSCNFNDAGVSLWPLNQIVHDTQYYVRDAVIDYTTHMGTVSPAIEGRLQFGKSDYMNHWASAEIIRFYLDGFTSGCSTFPLLFCPDAPTTRAQMAIFLERGMRVASYTPPPATGLLFADVPNSYWAAGWIENLARDGITTGCGSFNYCPERSVTRAEMAVLLLRASHAGPYTPPNVGSSTGFNDVSTSYWAAPWIKQLAAEGITVGCGGGNYCPENPVTRAEMAVFLIRTFNLP